MLMDKQLVFIGGLHRSGTTLINQLLRQHSQISGFHDTGVPADEGQHLQNIYPPDYRQSYPGHYGFNPATHWTENHPLVTRDNAHQLLTQWGRYWDLNKPYLIEKSPLNLLKTRFLQALFPHAKFLIIMRHPIAVAYALRKWNKRDSLESLLAHYFDCYQCFFSDSHYLKSWQLVKYENLVKNPTQTLSQIQDWCGVDQENINVSEIDANLNEKYFEQFLRERRKISRRLSRFERKIFSFENQANQYCYSLRNLHL
jgi:hypothetical protein